MASTPVSNADWRDREILKKILAPAGNLITTLRSTGFESKSKDFRIENYEFIASYNWKDVNVPTIYVPGCPPKWTPPKFPIRVPTNTGEVFIDEDSHRCPGAPFDPLFKALLAMHPDYDMSPVSLVTDRNNFHKLLRFTSNQQNYSWRIDVDIVGDTMFFSQWEVNTIHVINRAFESGRSRAFEKNFATLDDNLADSMSHHRIVRYTLGGLSCMVRFEADAHVDDGSGPTDSLLQTATEESAAGQTLEGEGKATEQDLVTAFGTMTVNPSTTITEQPSNKVKVILRVRSVPLASIAEMKCTSCPKLRGRQFAPQLWFSHTQNICIGYHKDGRIDKEVSPQDVSDRVEVWRADKNDRLKSMVGLIQDIKKHAKGLKNGKCMLVYEKGPRTLKLYERNGKGLSLPVGAKEKCWRGLEEPAQLRE